MSYKIVFNFNDTITDKEFVQVANVLAEVVGLTDLDVHIETVTQGRISTENLNAYELTSWEDDEDNLEGAS